METFAKRVLTIVAGLLVLVYVGYHIFMATYSPVEVHTVELYDEYETIDTEGLVLRSESLIPAQETGFVYYITENGTRVAKGGAIADVYADAESAAAHQHIEELNEEIEQLKTIQAQGENGRANLDLITNQLKNMQKELIFEASSPCFYELDEMADEMLVLMNKQQITIGTTVDYTARIDQLTAERNALMQNDPKPTGEVRSPIAGYFVSTVDGFEQPVKDEDVKTMTVDEVREAMAREPSVDASQYIGKVVGGYEWYLVCVVSSDDLAHLSVDSMVRLRLPFVSNDTIPVTVMSLNRNRDGEVAAVFRCDYMSSDLSDIRMEDVQILVEQHSGLRVPDEAVQFNDAQEAGVFILEGNVIKFRRIQVLHHSEQGSFSICAVVDDKQYLQLFDDIVMEGKNLYDGKIVNSA